MSYHHFIAAEREYFPVRRLCQVLGVLARRQRNHITLAVRARIRRKQAACQTHQTIYQLKQRCLEASMRHELSQPALVFAQALSLT